MAEHIRSRRPRRVRYHFSIVFFAAIFIFGYMFYTYFTSTQLEDVLSSVSDNSSYQDNNETPDNSDNSSDQSSVEDAEFVNPVPLCEKASEDYINDCVFIGDSITYGLASYNIVPSSNVFAGVAVNISTVETAKIDTQYGNMLIVDALSVAQPKNIYIMLGSNGVAWLNANEMYQYFSNFMKSLLNVCPESEIYIISVPPVTAEKQNAVNIPIANSDIDAYNEKLLDYCNRNEMNYLDLNSELKNESGVLPTDLAENDGMHFKYSAYSKFIDYILTHVAK